MGGARGSHPPHDLRAPDRWPRPSRRARQRAARQPARRLPAPQGAQGRRPRDRPAGRQPADLPGQPGRPRRAACRPRPFLEQHPRGLQSRRRTTRTGGLMTQQAQATSIRHEIVVDAPIDRAFSVFTEDFGAFKPREHNLLSVDIAETVFEAHEGGNVYDRGVDGSECRWARVLAYEPPDRVVISWDISPHWQIETDPGRTSEVEVRFTAETPGRTRVELEHRNLERHGPGWEPERDAGGGDAGWPLYLARFAEQVTASA